MKSVDNRSPLARRITDRHYRAIGSIPPLPLWQVVDDELAPINKALQAAADSLYDAYAEINLFLGCCSAKEIHDSFRGLKNSANRAERTRNRILALNTPSP